MANRNFLLKVLPFAFAYQGFSKGELVQTQEQGLLLQLLTVHPGYVILVQQRVLFLVYYKVIASKGLVFADWSQRAKPVVAFK